MQDNTIDTTKYTRHLSPGKFEGESPATEYYWEQMMDGDGETICSSEVFEPDEEHDDVMAELFRIDSEESEAFDLPIGHWFLLREDSQGFILGSVHATREAAEQRFRAWIGL